MSEDDDGLCAFCGHHYVSHDHGDLPSQCWASVPFIGSDGRHHPAITIECACHVFVSKPARAQTTIGSEDGEE